MRAAGYALAALCLSACSVINGGNTRPVSAPIISGEPRPTAGPSTEIAQCRSAGAAEARIQYPTGWDTRVGAAEVEDELLGGGSADRVALSAQPVPIGQGAVPTYPKAGLSPPTEAICEVKFDLSRRGVTSNVIAACSNPLFLAEAVRAVERAEFEPVRVNGQIASGVNLVYPVKFCIQD